MEYIKLKTKTKVGKLIRKDIGNINNINQSGYYWVKNSNDADWSISYYNHVNRSWSFINKNSTKHRPEIVNWNKIRYFEPEPTKGFAIYKKLLAMEIGDNFNRQEFVSTLYGNVDQFNKRSFDVLLANSKSKLKRSDDIELSKRVYKGISGSITRIK